MNQNQTIEPRGVNPFDIICFFAIVIILLMAAFGCNTEKHITKERVVVDSSAIQNLQKELSEKNTIIATQKQKIHELESIGIIFSECPPAINVDSLRQVLISGGCKQSTIDSLTNILNRQKTIIKRLTDGSLEIQSNSIKELQFTKDKLEETISTLKSDNAKLMKENQQLKTELSKKVDNKKADVVRKVVPGSGYVWWLLILGIGIGVFIDRKIFTKQ